MTEATRPPFAHYPPRPGALRLQLFGGPLDGWEVGVEEAAPPPAVRVNGPRHGDHTVWVTHTYAEQNGRYEYVTTEEDDIRSTWTVRPKP
jgi:hypothetical protein